MNEIDALLRQLEQLYEQTERDIEETERILRTQRRALNRITGLLRLGGLIKMKPKG